MNRRDLEPGNPFGNLKPPVPPDDLRERTLRRALEAASRGETRDIWTRILENRRLRIAWAGGIAALIVAHVALSVRPGGNRERPNRTTSTAERSVAAIAALPRLDARALPVGGRELRAELEAGERVLDGTGDEKRKGGAL